MPSDVSKRQVPSEPQTGSEWHRSAPETLTKSQWHSAIAHRGIALLPHPAPATCDLLPACAISRRSDWPRPSSDARTCPSRLVPASSLWGSARYASAIMATDGAIPRDSAASLSLTQNRQNPCLTAPIPVLPPMVPRRPFLDMSDMDNTPGAVKLFHQSSLLNFSSPRVLSPSPQSG